MISDLLGTPKPDDIRSACSGARAHMLKKPLKAPTTAVLYTLSPQASPEAVHLLCEMLVFDPVGPLLLPLHAVPSYYNNPSSLSSVPVKRDTFTDQYASNRINLSEIN